MSESFNQEKNMEEQQQQEDTKAKIFKYIAANPVPIIIIGIFVFALYSIALTGIGSFLFKLTFVLLSIPAIIMFALHAFGASEIFKNRNTLIKKWKKFVEDE